MTLDELIRDFPLEPRFQEYFFKSFSTMKQVMDDIVVNSMQMQLPERTTSDLCQIFFYASIDLEKHLDEQFQFGIDIINNHMEKQLNIFKKDIKAIAEATLSRGVPLDNILEYLCLYYDDVHRKIFPTQPIIL